MTAPELTAYHLGIAVHKLEPAMDVYRRMLGVTEWRMRDPMPNGTLIAFGWAGGIAFELLQVPEHGNSQIHEFLRQHGEGIQHIAFWTADLRASVENALAEGGRLVSTTTDASGNTSVQLIPGSAKPDLSNLDRVVFVEPGLGGVRIEYVGQIGERFIRDWLKDDFEKIVPVPHWAK